MKKYIAILDSGMGGLSVLLECKKLLPSYNYVYFSDSKNLPYGNKSKNRLKNLACENIKKLLRKFDIKIIILACNTLTTMCIDFLRKAFPEIIFVGVEPCIKLAKDSGYKRALIIATCGTIKNSLVIKKYASHEDFLLGEKQLATLVEKNRGHLYRLYPYVDKVCKCYYGKVDCVVLGCTHYVFIKKMFERLFSVPILDSGKYVAARVHVLTNRINLPCGEEIIFCDSGNSRENFWYFNKIALTTTSKYVILR